MTDRSASAVALNQAFQIPQQPVGGVIASDFGTVAHYVREVQQFGGSFYPRCACGYMGPPSLRPDRALAEPCEIEALWRTSDSRRRLVLGAEAR